MNITNANFMRSSLAALLLTGFDFMFIIGDAAVQTGKLGKVWG